jgi:hypothetical protein
MQRFLVSAKASSRVLSRGFAQAAEAAPATQLTLNFVTPHTPIYTKKVVSQVIVPGAAGEFGLTAGHSPIISELKPGVVTVIHAGVSRFASVFAPSRMAVLTCASVCVCV